jgi:predicted phage tail protein
VLRTIVPPLVAAYAVFVAMVIVTWRRPVPRGRRLPEKTPAHATNPPGSLLATAGGGYLVFLAIVLVFHVWLAGEADALGSAVLGGLFLSLITLGVSAISTGIARWLESRKASPRTTAE